ncbi:MAG: lactate utilization protein [Thermodesulfobacteriota bacterium]
MNATRDFVNWTSEKLCRQAVKALQKNEFAAIYCSEPREAFDYIIAEARTATTIGLGGSRSIADLKVAEALGQMGKEILVSKGPDVTPEQGMDIRRRQLTCDLFLCSANAVTLSGYPVNIDNTGNRTGAMTFGPRKVIMVVGRNKIVAGNIEDAIRRVKERAAPPNARRLKYETPCAKTGFCSDCSAPQRICRIITVMERKPARTDVRVLVVNADLGF